MKTKNKLILKRITKLSCALCPQESRVKVNKCFKNLIRIYRFLDLFAGNNAKTLLKSIYENRIGRITLIMYIFLTLPILINQVNLKKHIAQKVVLLYLFLMYHLIFDAEPEKENEEVSLKITFKSKDMLLEKMIIKSLKIIQINNEKILILETNIILIAENMSLIEKKKDILYSYMQISKQFRQKINEGILSTKYNLMVAENNLWFSEPLRRTIQDDRRNAIKENKKLDALLLNLEKINKDTQLLDTAYINEKILLQKNSDAVKQAEKDILILKKNIKINEELIDYANARILQLYKNDFPTVWSRFCSYLKKKFAQNKNNSENDLSKNKHNNNKKNDN